MTTQQSGRLRRLFRAAVGRGAVERLVIPSDPVSARGSNGLMRVGDLEMTDVQVLDIRIATILCWSNFLWPNGGCR